LHAAGGRIASEPAAEVSPKVKAEWQACILVVGAALAKDHALLPRNVPRQVHPAHLLRAALQTIAAAMLSS